MFTDDTEARGFSNTRRNVDVYSCSYGPGDNGYSLGTMGRFAKGAIETGAKEVV